MNGDVALKIRAGKGGMFNTCCLTANSFGTACYLTVYWTTMVISVVLYLSYVISYETRSPSAL